jgi:hypothetical protein
VILPDADADRPLVAMRPGTPRLVVAWPGANDTLVPELWDATTLTKIKSMEATYGGMQPMTATSPDGKRYLVLGCRSPSDQHLACDATIYDLALGSIVHRTKLPAFETGPYMIMPQLSEDGRWFAVSNEFFRSEIHSSDTGNLIARSPDHNEEYFHDDSGRVLFVDATHALNAFSFGSKMQLVDLESGRVLRSIDVHASPSADDFTSEHHLSPDKKSIALLVRRPLGAEAVVWNLDDGKSVSYSVPKHVCPSFCHLLWAGSKSLVAFMTSWPVKLRWRVDLDSGEQSVEPYAPSLVYDVAGFRVIGDLGATRYEGETTLAPHDHGPEVAPDWTATLQTPSGARVELGLVTAHRVQAAFGRFLDFGDGALRVVSPDGSIASIDNGRKRR